MSSGISRPKCCYGQPWRGEPVSGRGRSNGKHLPYGGILAEPLPKFSALDPDEKAATVLLEKTVALFKHYGLKPDDAHPLTNASPWAELAFALAREHVPGFKPAPPHSRRTASAHSDSTSRSPQTSGRPAQC